MRSHVLFFISVLLVPSLAQAELPVMPVINVLEEHYADGDQAVVKPDRLELVCEFNKGGPWGFCFAGFETTWHGPIDLEVQGSGGYGVNDIFSIAALSLDYGGKDGWIERSHFGLGLIQDSRNSHPPSWGVGNDGKFIMRGNLLNAKPEPRRITIEPSKYAPAGWDGRLWIGLMLHNVGAGKTLRVRILNAAPPSGVTLAGQGAQREFVRRYLRMISRDAREIKQSSVPEEFRDYLEQPAVQSREELVGQFENALQKANEGPLPSATLVGLEASYYRWRRSLTNKDADALNAFAAKWHAGGSFGSEIGCVVRAATNVDKVGLHDVESGRVLGADTEPIRISAARHEYEGFQLVLSALSNAVKKVSLSVSDLTGPRGSIPASNITINPVGYNRIFPGEAKEALVADPLLIGDVPELKSGENQPIWFTVRVPDDATAGEYSGKVTISAENGRSLSVPVSLRVRDFDIPKKISLRSSFWMFRDQLNRFYHLDEVDFDDYMKWIDFALEHRICPIDVFEGSCAQMLDVARKADDGESPVNPRPDFTNWDKYIDHMLAGGASTIHLGQSHHQGTFFSDAANPVASPQQIARVIENIKILRDHYKQKGVFDLHYLQLRDETSAPDSLNVYKEVQKALPDVKLLLTAPSGEARPYLMIPCPLTPGFDAGWRDEIKAKGGEYWWYVCCAPLGEWANLLSYQTGAQHRALFWQTWDRNVDGLLYWGLNFWTWYGAKWPVDAKGPTTRVPAKGDPNFIPVPGAPGDGFSMYPGPTPDKPLSSIRLECMRDGEEDYEYFVMLDSLIAKAEAKGDSSPVLKEARAARAAARKLVSSMTGYEKTGAPYLAVRERIGDAIERLLAAK